MLVYERVLQLWHALTGSPKSTPVETAVWSTLSPATCRQDLTKQNQSLNEAGELPSLPTRGERWWESESSCSWWLHTQNTFKWFIDLHTEIEHETTISINVISHVGRLNILQTIFWRFTGWFGFFRTVVNCFKQVSTFGLESHQTSLQRHSLALRRIRLSQ